MVALKCCRCPSSISGTMAALGAVLLKPLGFPSLLGNFWPPAVHGTLSEPQRVQGESLLAFSFGFCFFCLPFPFVFPLSLCIPFHFRFPLPFPFPFTDCRSSSSIFREAGLHEASQPGLGFFGLVDYPVVPLHSWGDRQTNPRGYPALASIMSFPALNLLFPVKTALSINRDKIGRETCLVIRDFPTS